MAKKSKNAAAAAAEPPAKKSKNAGAAVCGAAEVVGGEGGPRGAYRDAFQIGDEEDPECRLFRCVACYEDNSSDRMPDGRED